MENRKLNIELFKKVRERIATIPESYSQQTWYAQSDKAPCGTVACLAGETIICAAPTIEEGVQRLARLYDQDESGGYAVPHEAGRLLGLNALYGDGGIPPAANESAIFMGEANFWPEPYRDQFQNAESKEAEARIAVAYLDHIIETGKVLE